jgi:hypothetical protein
MVAQSPGNSNAYDTSAGTRAFRFLMFNSTTQLLAADAAGAFVQPTLPMTWAVGDVWSGFGSYQSAT